MKTTNEINVVRLAKGSNFVRFEIAKGCNWASMHNSAGDKGMIHIDEARERMALLTSQGWTARSATL